MGHEFLISCIQSALSLELKPWFLLSSGEAVFLVKDEEARALGCGMVPVCLVLVEGWNITSISPVHRVSPWTLTGGSNMPSLWYLERQSFSPWNPVWQWWHTIFVILVWVVVACGILQESGNVPVAQNIFPLLWGQSLPLSCPHAKQALFLSSQLFSWFLKNWAVGCSWEAVVIVTPCK